MDADLWTVVHCGVNLRFYVRSGVTGCAAGMSAIGRPVSDRVDQPTAAFASHFSLLGHLKRVVDLDAAVTHSAFELRVPE